MADKIKNPIELMATGRLKPADMDADFRRSVAEWAQTAPVEDVANGLNISLLILAREARIAEKLRQDAYKDPLTNIGNRRFLIEELSSGLELSSLFTSASFAQKSAGKQRAIVYIDLVGLTKINKMGQGAGDAALRAVGERLGQVVRRNEACARTGGDEFACVVGLDNASQGGEGIRKRFEREFEDLNYEYDGKKYPVQIYTAVFPVDSKLSAEKNFEIAGELLAKAKQRDRVGRDFSDQPDIGLN